jgi:hypothetical protein
MAVKTNSLGTLQTTFEIGKSNKTKLKNNSAVLELRNTGDSAFLIFRSLDANSTASPNDNDAVTFFDLKSSDVLIEFDFNGGSPPAPADNTGKFGFCFTTGGAYTQGRVYYDTGSALLEVKHITKFATTTAIVGTISLNANGIYYKQAGTWTLKGDGASSGTGNKKVIKIPFAYTDTSLNSTTSLADGTQIDKITVVKLVAFNGTAPTLAIKVDGATDLPILATSDNDLKSTTTDVSLDAYVVGSANAGVVNLAIVSDSSSAGNGYVLVEYSDTQNA